MYTGTVPMRKLAGKYLCPQKLYYRLIKAIEILSGTTYCTGTSIPYLNIAGYSNCQLIRELGTVLET